LQSLRKIAFGRDSCQISWRSAESYYESRAPIGRYADDLGNSADPHPAQERERREKLCGQQHRQRMLLQARGYVRLLPKLQWLYFRQIPMRVAYSGRRSLCQRRETNAGRCCAGCLDGRSRHDGLRWLNSRSRYMCEKGDSILEDQHVVAAPGMLSLRNTGRSEVSIY
jgi:hypothetical protein